MISRRANLSHIPGQPERLPLHAPSRQTGQRHASGCDQDAVGGHGAFDLVQPTHPSDDAGVAFEENADTGGGRKLERPNRSDAELNGFGGGARRRRRDGDPADLREQLDEDHRWNDRLPWKVSLEIEVISTRPPAAGRALTV